jgi:transcriptional antiterminator NusG
MADDTTKGEEKTVVEEAAQEADLDSATQPDVEETPADEPADEPAEEYEIPDEAEWYVVHTYSGYENKVRQNLEHRIESMGMLEQIFQVVVPVEEEVDIKDGQRRIVERKIFPGYVLVHMILTDQSWSVVRNTPGVTGFVGSGTDASDRLRPTPLRQEDVDRILRRMEAEEPTIRVSFRQGQNVRIVDGPFTDFHGAVDSIDMERGKVRLMVNFFGRETPVELDFLQVEKV